MTKKELKTYLTKVTALPIEKHAIHRLWHIVRICPDIDIICAYAILIKV